MDSSDDARRADRPGAALIFCAFLLCVLTFSAASCDGNKLTRSGAAELVRQKLLSQQRDQSVSMGAYEEKKNLLAARFGFVRTKEEALKICTSKYIGSGRWPLQKDGRADPWSERIVRLAAEGFLEFRLVRSMGFEQCRGYPSQSLKKFETSKGMYGGAKYRVAEVEDVSVEVTGLTAPADAFGVTAMRAEYTYRRIFAWNQLGRVWLTEEERAQYGASRTGRQTFVLHDDGWRIGG